MSEFGDLVLVIGDLHIPHRKDAIPPAFASLIKNGTYAHVICTGNLCSREMFEYVRTLAPSVHIVRGDLDSGATASTIEMPESKTIQIGAIRVGVIHGHTIIPWGDTRSLANQARQTDVDVIVSGQTHQTAVASDDGGSLLLINPGSLTGAYSAFMTAITPSFQCLAIKGNNITIFTYELKGNEVRVMQSSWTKPK